MTAQLTATEASAPAIARRIADMLRNSAATRLEFEEGYGLRPGSGAFPVVWAHAGNKPDGFLTFHMTPEAARLVARTLRADADLRQAIGARAFDYADLAEKAATKAVDLVRRQGAA